MEIVEEHKPLLRQLGLRDDDFARFDGEFVRYEFDPDRGVRIYDPYYTTSYNEYIGIDGWSAWSSENDTFMSDILRGSREKLSGKAAPRTESDMEEISKALQKKFGKRTDTAPK
jgi:hypothetical protein